MNKRLLIAGCSNIAGSEIDGHSDSPYNRENSFGNVLAKKLGYKPVNIAISGATNSGILRTVIDYVTNDSNTDEINVLVGWTDSLRMEIPYSQKTWYKKEWNQYVDYYADINDDFIRINAGYIGNGKKEQEFIANYHKFMSVNLPYLEIFSANCILQLQYFLESRRINYLFASTLTMFALENEPTVNFYKKLIDQTRFIDFDKPEESFYIKYKNLGYKNKKATYWHHDEIPHLLYADYLYDYVVKNKIF